VHLRSFKLPAPKAALLPKVTQALTELGINHTRLVMPTRENCARLESLIEATTALIDTKKVVDRVEQDIRVLRVRLGRASEGAEDDGKEGTPMDVDGDAGAGADIDADADADADAEGEVDGRAQSILSTRSGRGRKQVRCSSQILSIPLSKSQVQSRRSMSVSSIGTSASARVGKRQKRG
jgi:DNA methyltransferase 1-associated protein 1